MPQAIGLEQYCHEGSLLLSFSQALSSQVRKKSVYEKELIAIVLAIQKWRHYLLGHRFVVISGQRSLKYLLEQRVVECQIWLLKLLDFNFGIQYKPRQTNLAANALSRMPIAMENQGLSSVSPLDWTTLARKAQEYRRLHDIIHALELGNLIASGWALVRGQLRYKGRLVLSKDSKFKERVLQKFHSSPIGGHRGFLKTNERVSAKLFQEGMKADIKHFVAACLICHQN